MSPGRALLLPRWVLVCAGLQAERVSLPYVALNKWSNYAQSLITQFSKALGRRICTSACSYFDNTKYGKKALWVVSGTCYNLLKLPSLSNRPLK